MDNPRGKVSGKMSRVVLRGAIELYRVPIMAALGVVRFLATRELLDDAILCATCGAEIAILGLWECGRCGYTWAGWYFSPCEICGDTPPYISCNVCSASTANPLL